MRKYIIGIFLCLSINLFAQDCSVDSFVVKNYSFDAELLAVREIQSDFNHIYWDSVNVPSTLKYKYLKILSSVYNNKDTGLIDTLFNHFKIHVFAEYSEISIEVNPTVNWVKTLITDSIYSGNPTIDSIMKDYSFRLIQTMDLGNHFYIFIKSPITLNLLPVIDKLKETEGVKFVEFFGFQVIFLPTDCGDDDGANDIQIIEDKGFKYLIFKKSMGACPDYCFGKKYWKFQIINECVINFIESYCQTYDGLSDTKIIQRQIAYPNPFNNEIRINLSVLSQFKTASLFNAAGVLVAKTDQDVIQTGGLKPGIYIMKIELGNEYFYRKMIKN
jgi:hypothetical protein